MNEKLIDPLFNFLKYIISLSMFFYSANNAGELYVEYNKNKPSVTTMKCNHLIAESAKPFLFHGKVIFTSKFEAQDWQTMNNRAEHGRFNAIYAKSDAGQIVLLYSKYTDDLPNLKDMEIIGWIVQSDQNYGGKIGHPELDGKYLPICYPIELKTIIKN